MRIVKKYWSRFRDSGSQRAERGHWGLAWSVFAGYFLAGAVFVKSFQHSGNVAVWWSLIAALFFLMGGLGAYMAFAVAMRLPPHHAKLRDDAQYDRLGVLYYQGTILLSQWAKLAVEAGKPQQPNSATPEQIGEMAEAQAQQCVNWVESSKPIVESELGVEAGKRYKMAPTPSMTEPAWSLNTKFVGLWNALQGQLEWLREWLQEQLNL